MPPPERALRPVLAQLIDIPLRARLSSGVAVTAYTLVFSTSLRGHIGQELAYSSW